MSNLLVLTCAELVQAFSTLTVFAGANSCQYLSSSLPEEAYININYIER